MRHHRLLPATSILLLLAGACDGRAPSTAPRGSLAASDVASETLPAPYEEGLSAAQVQGAAPSLSVAPFAAATAGAVSTDGMVTIDFEGYTSLVPISTQYSALGVTFSGAATLVQGAGLNSPFPPHSGRVVMFDWPVSAAGVMTATFERAVSSVGAYVTANRIITMTCFDRSGAELGQSVLPAPNYLGASGGVAPNYLLSVAARGIMSCTFHDHGNSFTMDDFTFDPSGSGRLPQHPDTPGMSRHGTDYICRGAPLPAGWVRVDAIYVDPRCGASHQPYFPDSWVISSYFDQPIGSRMLVCRGESLPANWELSATNPPESLRCTWPGSLGFTNGGAVWAERMR